MPARELGRECLPLLPHAASHCQAPACLCSLPGPRECLSRGWDKRKPWSQVVSGQRVSYDLKERMCIGSMTTLDSAAYQRVPTDEAEAQMLASADLDGMKSEPCGMVQCCPACACAPASASQTCGPHLPPPEPGLRLPLLSPHLSWCPANRTHHPCCPQTQAPCPAQCPSLQTRSPCCPSCELAALIVPLSQCFSCPGPSTPTHGPCCLSPRFCTAPSSPAAPWFPSPRLPLLCSQAALNLPACLSPLALGISSAATSPC